MFLCLDLGTFTGWAVDDGGPLISGSISFKPGRHEGGGMRFLRFRDFLEEMRLKRGPIEAIYYEEVRRHKGVDAAHIYGGLWAHLTSWCEHHRIPYQGVPVGEIKKLATGKGNANKEAMVAAMRRRGHQLGDHDDDEADALAIAYWRRLTRPVLNAA